jgi:hypothetical protein
VNESDSREDVGPEALVYSVVWTIQVLAPQGVGTPRSQAFSWCTQEVIFLDHLFE